MGMRGVPQNATRAAAIASVHGWARDAKGSTAPTAGAHQPVFNVRDARFSAAGDGARDDTAAIQRAVDAAGAVAGVVLLPRGSYKITRDVTIGPGADGVTIGGEGHASVITHASTATARGAIAIRGRSEQTRVKRVAVRDLKIVGTATGSRDAFFASNKGVFIEYAEDVVVERVWVERVRGEAIYAQEDGERIEFLDCDVLTCAHNAYCHNGLIRRAAVENCRAVDVGNMGYEGSADDLRLLANYFKGCRNHGIMVGAFAAGANWADRVAIQGNVVTGGTNASAYGVILYNGVRDAVVSGNVVRDNAHGGIYVSYTGTNRDTNVQRVTIADNVFFDNAAPYQVFAAGRYTVIRDNLVGRSARGGVYGIYCDAPGDLTQRVEGNRVLNHAKADIHRTAAGVATVGRNWTTAGAVAGDGA